MGLKTNRVFLPPPRTADTGLQNLRLVFGSESHEAAIFSPYALHAFVSKFGDCQHGCPFGFLCTPRGTHTTGGGLAFLFPLGQQLEAHCAHVVNAGVSVFEGTFWASFQKESECCGSLGSPAECSQGLRVVAMRLDQRRTCDPKKGDQIRGQRFHFLFCPNENGTCQDASGTLEWSPLRPPPP